MSEKVVLVTGGRDYRDEVAIAAALEAEAPIDRLIHGGCPSGADIRAWKWAQRRGIAVSIYPADWRQYGSAAGPVRNAEMAVTLAEYRDAGCEVLVLAFPGGSDTADMVRQAKLHGLPIKEIGRSH